MKIIKRLFVFQFILFFLFINYNSLFWEFFTDKNLDNGTSVSTLAKDVASNASCDLDVFGSLIETTDTDTQHMFWCTHRRKNLHFLIHIFTTQAEKNTFLSEDTKRKHYFQKTFKSYYNPKHDRNLTRGQPEFYNPCFKHGKYYVVCEDANWDMKTGVPQFNGAPYYHEFKGEDLDWKMY